MPISMRRKKAGVSRGAPCVSVGRCAAETAQQVDYNEHKQMKLQAQLGPGTLRVKLLDMLHYICCEGHPHICEFGECITWEALVPGK